jgi:hypothetical protein
MPRTGPKCQIRSTGPSRRDATDLDHEISKVGIDDGMASNVKSVFFDNLDRSPPHYRQPCPAIRRHGRRRLAFRLVGALNACLTGHV